jgi:hypothetical protein
LPARLPVRRCRAGFFMATGPRIRHIIREYEKRFGTAKKNLSRTREGVKEDQGLRAGAA